MSKARNLLALVALQLVIACSSPVAVETEAIGLTSSLDTIDALIVPAGTSNAATIVVLGGLDGQDTERDRIESMVNEYAGLSGADRSINLYAVPNANPEASALSFPPEGAAYRDNTESHALWRWLGLLGPDLVMIIGADDSPLIPALEASDVAGVEGIPVRMPLPSSDLVSLIRMSAPPSPARIEIERRRERSAEQFANQLAPIYGQNFGIPIYTDGMALIAHLRLGNLEHVETLAEQYVDGSRDSLESAFGVSTLVLAGHLVLAELAEITGDNRYLERARAAADLSFDENGEMLEAVPNHGEMSDAIFMGASILAAVGDLTGEQRYFDMAVRQIDFMNTLVHRDDGLYRHSPLAEAAWGRGNGFAAIGYALTLSKLPTEHPDFDRILDEYRSYMQILASWQNDDGSWSQVIDYPGVYHETSSTAIIGFSMQRGINRGWLGPEFENNASRAFQAVLTRTDFEGRFIDVSESTNKQPTSEDYLLREALYGQDNRTGSFAMLFATERMAANNN